MSLTTRYSHSAPGRNRTCDLRFRKPLLYPLSYGGGDGTERGTQLVPRASRSAKRLPTGDFARCCTGSVAWADREARSATGGGSVEFRQL